MQFIVIFGIGKIRDVLGGIAAENRLLKAAALLDLGILNFGIIGRARRPAFAEQASPKQALESQVWKQQVAGRRVELRPPKSYQARLGRHSYVGHQGLDQNAFANSGNVPLTEPIRLRSALSSSASRGPDGLSPFARRCQVCRQFVCLICPQPRIRELRAHAT